MKETTGDLNITIVIVIGIAILVAFFYFVIWPGLDDNFKSNSKCSRAVCENPCKDYKGSKNACDATIGQLVKCYYVDEKGNRYDNIYCPWKG